MYIDASAIVAILDREPEGPAFISRLEAAMPPFYVSPAGLFEAVLSLAAKKARRAGVAPDAGLIDLARASVLQFVDDLGAEEIEIGARVRQLAIDAAARYGRAVGSEAKLNFGDCFAYACARSRSVPILYKGNDFSLTDLA